jgi:hypothetical protein
VVVFIYNDLLVGLNCLNIMNIYFILISIVLFVYTFGSNTRIYFKILNFIIYYIKIFYKFLYNIINFSRILTPLTKNVYPQPIIYTYLMKLETLITKIYTYSKKGITNRLNKK